MTTHVVCSVCGAKMEVEASGRRGDPVENTERKLGRECRAARGHRAQLVRLPLAAGDADRAEGASEGG